MRYTAIIEYFNAQTEADVMSTFKRSNLDEAKADAVVFVKNLPQTNVFEVARIEDSHENVVWRLEREDVEALAKAGL